MKIVDSNRNNAAKSIANHCPAKNQLVRTLNHFDCPLSSAAA